MLHETILAATKRRLKFEMGMRAKHLEVILPNYQYYYERFGIVEHEICPVVVGKMCALPKPNPAEVASTKTMPWSQFVAEVNAHPDEWSEWCVEETKLLANSPEFKSWFTKHCSHAT
jgi:isopentenyl-diphosphate delta-isomerase